MEALLNIVEQTQTFIRIVIALLILGIILFTIRIMRRAYRPHYDSSNMPANLWFYSKLINLEVGNEKANYQNLHNHFIGFLHKKYRIRKDDLKTNTIFEIVRKREENSEMLDFYGEIWNSIEDLKKSDTSEVVAYTKTIKTAFNKEDISEWLDLQKIKKPCNDC